LKDVKFWAVVALDLWDCSSWLRIICKSLFPIVSFYKFYCCKFYC